VVRKKEKTKKVWVTPAEVLIVKHFLISKDLGSGLLHRKFSVLFPAPIEYI
jgi:hypothetical protein